MIGILDTHTFIWAVEDSPDLSATARAFIADPANTILLSAASVWEIVIKQMAGKLTMAVPIETTLAQLPARRIGVLPVLVDHVLAVQQLPNAHRDPFDRILAAQAITERAVLLTKDAVFAHYPVAVIW